MHRFKFPEEQKKQENPPNTLHDHRNLQTAVGLVFMVKCSEQLKAGKVIYEHYHDHNKSCSIFVLPL